MTDKKIPLSHSTLEYERGFFFIKNSPLIDYSSFLEALEAVVFFAVVFFVAGFASFFNSS